MAQLFQSLNVLKVRISYSRISQVQPAQLREGSKLFEQIFRDFAIKNADTDNWLARLILRPFDLAVQLLDRGNDACFIGLCDTGRNEHGQGGQQ